MIFVGFLIRYKTTKKIVRKKFLDHVEAQRKPDQEKKLYTKMPCGKEYIFTYEDFPLVGMPCNCENPNHWVVKYERQGLSGPSSPISDDPPSVFLKDGRKEGEKETGPKIISEGGMSDIEGNGI